MVGGGNGHRVNGLVVENAAHVGLNDGPLAGLLKDHLRRGFGARPIHFDQRGDLEIRNRQHLFDMSRTAPSDTHNGDPQAVVGLRPGLLSGSGSEQEMAAFESHIGILALSRFSQRAGMVFAV